MGKGKDKRQRKRKTQAEIAADKEKASVEATRDGSCAASVFAKAGFNLPGPGNSCSAAREVKSRPSITAEPPPTSPTSPTAAAAAAAAVAEG